MSEELKHFNHKGYFFTVGVHEKHSFPNGVTWMINGFQGQRWKEPLESLGPWLPEVCPGDVWELAEKNCRNVIDQLIEQVEEMAQQIVNGLRENLEAALMNALLPKD